MSGILYYLSCRCCCCCQTSQNAESEAAAADRPPAPILLEQTSQNAESEAAAADRPPAPILLEQINLAFEPEEIPDEEMNPPIYENVSEQSAVDNLAFVGNEKGTYLIQEDKLEPGSFVLSILTEEPGVVQHYPIRRTTNGRLCITHMETFNNLKELAVHYEENVNEPPCKLKKPGRKLTEDEEWRNRKQIKLINKIGSGNFGTVWKGRFRGAKTAAVKVLTVGTMAPHKFLAEADALQQLQHPNVVECYQVVKTEPTWIVTEYMENGNLRDWLRKEDQNLSKHEHIKIARQIIDGMTYIAEKKYVHRDLRAANILVSANKKYKIADLGMARLLADDVYCAAVGAKFPVKWAAPEVIRFRIFSTKSDIWSFGVLLAEIATGGEEPYCGLANNEVTEDVKDRKVMVKPGACSINWYAVMQKCWAFKAVDRPSFKELQDRFKSGTEEGEPDWDAKLVDRKVANEYN